MKKILSTLIALLLLFGVCAFALEGSGYPAYDGGELPDNHLAGSFSGDALILEFDPDGDYSFADQRTLQCCFFAFDESETHYIELYMELPATLQSGDTLSSDDFLQNLGGSTALSFYEITSNTEVFYYAGSVLGVPYPDGSSYEISIDEAAFTDSTIEISGRLSATLVRFEGNRSMQEQITLSDARFHLELPIGENAAAPKGDTPDKEQPKDDSAKLNPPAIAPAFTLPPNAVSL